MDIKDAQGTFTIDSTTNTKTCNISLRIPQQVIYLRSYRVEFDTQAHALATQIVYVDVPWLSGNQLLDTNPGYVYLPVLLDNAVVSYTFGKSIPVYLSADIPETFPIRFLDTNFQPVANLVRITLQFSITKGSLG
jgi:hypothetical protein